MRLWVSFEQALARPKIGGESCWKPRLGNLGSCSTRHAQAARGPVKASRATNLCCSRLPTPTPTPTPPTRWRSAYPDELLLLLLPLRLHVLPASNYDSEPLHSRSDGLAPFPAPTEERTTRPSGHNQETSSALIQ
jgi:hypothetical protein